MHITIYTMSHPSPISVELADDPGLSLRMDPFADGTDQRAWVNIGKTSGVEGPVHVALDDVIAIVPAST